MQKFGLFIARHRALILILAALLIVPSIFGMAATRVNYDMLVYLPSEMDTMAGQEILLDDFSIGSFSFIIVDGMSAREVSALREKLEGIRHVTRVLWYDSLADLSLPMEALPEKVTNAFNREGSTVMLAFLDTSTSEDGSLDATEEIRRVAGARCFVAGMSALVVDLKNLCETEEPVYVALAVACATAMMMLLLDSFLIPLVFLMGIGVAILFNMGTNFFMGEISYITKALAAVLQLAVTMDYSIFLWHSYTQHKRALGDKQQAMARAISETFTSVLGSALTTVAGFLTFCAMSFTLGIDLGIVMAKGVLLGLLCSLTVLPAMILALDKPLEKTRHKPLIPPMDGAAKWIVKRGWVFLVIFALLIAPAYLGYKGTNDSVYYDMGKAMPKDIDYVIANTRLQDEYGLGASYLIMANSGLSAASVRRMLDEIGTVDGVQFALGMESVVGAMIPEEALPETLTKILKSDRWRLLLVGSKYYSSSDEINAELEQVSEIVKKYDAGGMLVGEAPLVKDMIQVTDEDFRVVTILSIAAVFVIILLVTGSLSLPVILVSVIEFAVFVNMAISYFAGNTMAFIGPICISTIQLGSTVDYAILLSTNYKTLRASGEEKRAAMARALSASLPSVITSALCFFAATFGVAVYSEIGVIRAMCELMARGALVSMGSVLLVLPGLLLLLDGAVRSTTLHMNKREGIR